MEERKERSHALLLPYPTQGHVNPLLQFGKRLVSRGIKITLANTIFINKSARFDAAVAGIGIASISDGFDRGGYAEAASDEEYMESLKTTGSRTLAEILEKLEGSGQRVSCVVYDSFLPWALDVAKQFGVLGAAFFTQLCIVDAVYYHVHHGNLAISLAADETTVHLLPGLPPLETPDLPSFVSDWGSFPAYRELLINQFCNVEKAEWILLNTFHQLEPEAIKWMEGILPAKAIGPTIPSAYLDRRLEGDRDYSVNLVREDDGGKCVQWLDERAVGSVVYVAFGSLATPGVEQMEELASGLKMSKQHFIWVVRGSEIQKLPEGFAESTAGTGLIVTWCSQLQVLSHKAVGCFLSHCGWNSTLEALSLGVPIVGVPQWSDQTTNAKCVVDLWKVGVKARADEKGIVRKEELEICIRQVMEEEKGEEFKKNAKKWSESAQQALEEGGSSDRSIDEFVTSINS